MLWLSWWHRTQTKWQNSLMALSSVEFWMKLSGIETTSVFSISSLHDPDFKTLGFQSPANAESAVYQLTLSVQHCCKMYPRKRSRHPLLEHSQKQLHLPKEKKIEFRSNYLFAFIHVQIKLYVMFHFQSLIGGRCWTETLKQREHPGTPLLMP